MKRTTKAIIIALLILIASNAFGQANFQPIGKLTLETKKDTTKLDSLTRDTKFLSINDVFRIYETMTDKIVVKDARVFENIMQAILNEAVKEYYDKPKTQKK